MGDFNVLADYEQALAAVREHTDFVPKIGIVLGSGLGGLADDIEVVTRIPYSELEGFPRSTVDGHKGEYIFGYLGSVPVVLMNGRVHFYEGYPIKEIAKMLNLTEAAVSSRIHKAKQKLRTELEGGEDDEN